MCNCRPPVFPTQPSFGLLHHDNLLAQSLRLHDEALALTSLVLHGQEDLLLLHDRLHDGDITEVDTADASEQIGKPHEVAATELPLDAPPAGLEDLGAQFQRRRERRGEDLGRTTRGSEHDHLKEGVYPNRMVWNRGVRRIVYIAE
jgi:hypothetical protein